MKRVLLLAVLMLAAWQAWERWPQLKQRPPEHEAVIENKSGRTIERMRLMIGDQTLVKEVIPVGQQAKFIFRVNRDESFQLHWEWADNASEARWGGGKVTQGPIAQLHTFSIHRDGGLVHTVRTRPAE